MQEFENGQEVEVRKGTWKRTVYIGQDWYKADDPTEHHAVLDPDNMSEWFRVYDDDIRPARRTVLEIAADHKWREDFPYHVHANVTAVRLDAIRVYAWEHHGVDLDD